MRTFVKHLILMLNAIFRRDTSPKVVFYHDVGTAYTPMGTPESLFRSHMEYLRQLGEKALKGDGNTAIPNSSLQLPTLHQVAFDDGFRGIWDHRELLREHEVHPIVFIAVALVGQPGYLTWDEIRTLQNDYGFDFQCHTWSHQTLVGPVNTDLPIPTDPNFRTDAWYRHELVDSKTELERQLNKKIDSLCFPVGYFSDAVIRRCAAAGYTELYASFPGNKEDNLSVLQLQLPSSTKLISRILCQSLSLADFKLALVGGMNPLRARYLKMHYCK